MWYLPQTLVLSQVDVGSLACRIMPNHEWHMCKMPHMSMENFKLIVFGFASYADIMMCIFKSCTVDIQYFSHILKV